MLNAAMLYVLPLFPYLPGLYIYASLESYYNMHNMFHKTIHPTNSRRAPTISEPPRLDPAAETMASSYAARCRRCFIIACWYC